MPNRVLRDWTDSETMNNITSQAERFFTRLIMKADDFGCFHANPKLLKAALFPLNDEIRDINLSKWLNECAKAGLVQVYKVEGKTFLQIIDFGQRLRQSRSKFPQPHEADPLTIDSNSPPLSAIVRKSPPETETETEVETETETEVKPRQAVPDMFFGVDVHAAWEEWKKYKAEKKQKLTPSTEKKQRQFLGGREGPEAIAIINQSITNGWTGLFELKTNGSTNNRRHTQGTIRRADAVIEQPKEYGEF
jgi:hypothetical protein